MKEETAKKLKALDRANKWVSAGKKAHDLALATEKAALEGEIIPATPENIVTTIQGAMKLFLDGNISNPHVKKVLQERGLDMNNLRRAIVEPTVANAVLQIIDEGNIERLDQIAKMAGEKPDVDIPDGAKKITRERVIVEIE